MMAIEKVCLEKIEGGSKTAEVGSATHFKLEVGRKVVYYKCNPSSEPGMRPIPEGAVLRKSYAEIKGDLMRYTLGFENSEGKTLGSFHFSF